VRQLALLLVLDGVVRVARVLKVTAKGQVVLGREVLRHLEIGESASLAAELLPGGRVELRAALPAGSIEDFFHCVPPGWARLTIEDIGELAAQGRPGRA